MPLFPIIIGYQFFLVVIVSNNLSPGRKTQGFPLASNPLACLS